MGDTLDSKELPTTEADITNPWTGNPDIPPPQPPQPNIDIAPNMSVPPQMNTQVSNSLQKYANT